MAMPSSLVLPDPGPSSRFQLFQAFIFEGYFPRWLSDKESTCQAGDVGLIPGLGRFPGEGNGNPFQYSCLGGPQTEAGYSPQGHKRVRHDLETKQQHLMLSFVSFFFPQNTVNIFCLLESSPLPSKGGILYICMYTHIYIHTKKVYITFFLATLYGIWGVLVSGPGTEPLPPVVEAWSLNC